MELNLRNIITRKNNILTADFDSSNIVILDSSSSHYFGFEGTAGFIWECLENKISIEELSNKLLDKFEINKSQSENDCLEFCNNLFEKDLIELAA